MTTNEPFGMRVADGRINDGWHGKYDLADGRTVKMTWLPTDGQHVVIVVWDATGVLVSGEPVVRANAARESEQILKELEAQPAQSEP